MEQVGIENLKKIFVAASDIVLVFDKLSNHEGIFSLFQFSGDLNALSSVNLDAMKAEVKDLSLDERKALEQLLRDKLVLHNKVIEAKINDGLDLVEEGIVIVGQVVGLVNKVKTLLQ